MALYHNATSVVGRFLECLHNVMFCWVVRVALLSLGVWCAYPQPYAHPLDS